MKSITLLLGILFCLTLFAEEIQESDRSETAQKPKSFTSQTIDSGFVFIDGKYIDPPYKFEVKRVKDVPYAPPGSYPIIGTVYLNNIMLYKCRGKLQHFDGSVDPDLPRGIDKNTPFRSGKVSAYIQHKHDYAVKNLTIEEEKKFLEKAFRNLPMIKKVETYKYKGKECDGAFTLYTYNNKKYHVPGFTFRRKSVPYDPFIQTCLQVNKDARILLFGGAIFFNKKYWILKIKESTTAKTLIAALNSASNKEERLSTYQKVLGKTHYQKFLGKTHKENPIVSQFQGSPQLDKRL